MYFAEVRCVEVLEGMYFLVLVFGGMYFWCLWYCAITPGIFDWDSGPVTANSQLQCSAMERKKHTEVDT